MLSVEYADLLTAVELLGDIVGAINGELMGQDPLGLIELRDNIERVQDLLNKGVEL